MKIKILNLLFLLCASISLQAMILTTGEIVDRKTAESTTNAINYLKKEDLGLLSVALHACQKYSGSIPRCIQSTREFNGDSSIILNGLAKAQALNIADVNGNIPNDVCKVLCAALAPTAFRKAPMCAPGFLLGEWGIRNPISYRNYFSWNYWFPGK